MIKHTMIPFLLIAAFVSNEGAVWAAPAITSVAGLVNDGKTVSVTGTGFGVKASATPLISDDFEADTAGTMPAGWIKKTGNPVVSTDRIYSGKQAFLSVNPAASTSNQIIYDLGAGSITKKMYISSDIFIEKNDTNLGYQWKVWRVSGYPNVYYANNYPDVKTDNSGYALNAFWNGASAYYNPPTTLGWYNTGSFVYTKSGASQTNYAPGNRNMFGNQNTWFRIEQVITLSSAPDTPDGRIDTYTNGVLNTSWTGLTTQSAGDQYWRYLMLTNELESVKDSTGAATSSANMKFYFDNFYVDNTIARVEVCNGSTWAGRGQCEIQPPVTWSDTAVSFKFNTGHYIKADIAYLYVVDPNGTANANGFKIKIGSPLPPKNVGTGN